MIGVGRPREAIDAAMLAAAIGIDRPVEADVGRGVAGQDRLRMFYCDRRSPGDDAVEALDTVQPVALDDPLLEVEARRGGVARRAARLVRLDRHGASLVEALEHNKNR